jgi:hypothetical protein
MLEKEIERRICDYAKSKNMLAYKFTSPARIAVPDRLFIAENGYMFFCEFKAEGKKPTPAQEREHHRLRQQNVKVYVIDNIDDGVRMIDANS